MERYCRRYLQLVQICRGQPVINCCRSWEPPRLDLHTMATCSLLSRLHLCSGAAPSGEVPASQTLVVLHGLTSQAVPYVRFAQLLIDRLAELTGKPWAALLVDQRKHGGSRDLPGFEPPHTIQASAGDVLQLLRWALLKVNATGNEFMSTDKPCWGMFLGVQVAARQVPRLLHAWPSPGCLARLAGMSWGRSSRHSPWLGIQ